MLPYCNPLLCILSVIWLYMARIMPDEPVAEPPPGICGWAGPTCPRQLKPTVWMLNLDDKRTDSIEIEHDPAHVNTSLHLNVEA